MSVFTAFKFSTKEDFKRYIKDTKQKPMFWGISMSDNKGSILITTQFPLPTGFFIIKTKKDEEIKIRVSSGDSNITLEKNVERSYINLTFDRLEHFRAYINMARKVNVENVVISKDIFIVRMRSDTLIPDGTLVAETREGGDIKIGISCETISIT